MAIERWSPRRTFTRQEQSTMKRLKRTRKLFAFLREVRHELFEDAFQAELETMYRDTSAGKPPLPPAKLAMAALLHGYLPGLPPGVGCGGSRDDHPRPALADGARLSGPH